MTEIETRYEILTYPFCRNIKKHFCDSRQAVSVVLGVLHRHAMIALYALENIDQSITIVVPKLFGLQKMQKT